MQIKAINSIIAKIRKGMKTIKEGKDFFGGLTAEGYVHDVLGGKDGNTRKHDEGVIGDCADPNQKGDRADTELIEGHNIEPKRAAKGFSEYVRLAEKHSGKDGNKNP